MQRKIDEIVSFYGELERKARASFDIRAIVLFVLLLLTFAAAAGYVILRLQRSTKALRESGREMQAAMEKQSELAELKTRFVSMTSHEFRTPLSRVVSSSEMISAYGALWGPEKIETHLRRIRESALSMTKMLDSILLIGRSEAGMLKFEPAPLELREFCQELIETVEQSTSTKGRIVLSLRCSDTLVGDENLLRHALENLLTNAIKYSPSDSTVSLAVDEFEGEIQFAVTDHGIGIPEGDLTHLFESFHRGTNVGRISGTGLGLSIVKRAADLHRGTVWVESKEGEGSLFSLRIPAMKDVA
jgi:signal transduction histidine kinase